MVASPTCIFCGISSSIHLYSTNSNQFGSFSLQRCNACRAVFLWPRPTQQQLDEAYDDTYFGERDNKFGKSVESVLDRFRGLRAHRVVSCVPTGSTILDVGCGNGRFLGFLSKKGYRCHGVELPGKAADRAKKNPKLTIKPGRIEDIDFEENRIDMATMWHVFEHLQEPHSVLDSLSKTIKPGGFLAISMPNIQSWQARVFKGHWFHLDPPRHLFFFGSKDLENALRNYGFSLQKKSFFSSEQNPFGMQQSLLNFFGGPRDALFDSLKGSRHRQGPKGLLLFQKIFCLVTAPVFIFLSVIEAAFRSGGTFEMVFRNTGRQDSISTVDDVS